MDGEAMELKDMILSTLAELDAVAPKEEVAKTTEIQETVLEIEEEVVCIQTLPVCESENVSDMQKQFYINLRERILVLFEGFQSPNNKNIEAKIDLTLNFLEYLLATIDEQLEKLDKSAK